jgi:hypothetical protein
LTLQQFFPASRKTGLNAGPFIARDAMAKSNAPFRLAPSDEVAVVV